MLKKLREELIPAVIRAGLIDTQNLTGGTLHGFRHYFVSQCVRHNLPIPYIQREIGHSSSRIIERYIHLYRDDAVRRLSGVDFLGGTDADSSAF